MSWLAQIAAMTNRAAIGRRLDADDEKLRPLQDEPTNALVL
jgi:hypothetical protein